MARGEALTIPAPLLKTGRRRAVPWVLGGAGVLAAGAVRHRSSHSIAMATRRTSHDSIAMGNSPRAVADDYERTVTSRDHFVTATWILGGAAVAAGATGALLYLFDGRARSRSGSRR